MGMVLLEIARKIPRVFSYFEENCFAFTQGGCYNIIALERGPIQTLQFPFFSQKFCAVPATSGLPVNTGTANPGVE